MVRHGATWCESLRSGGRYYWAMPDWASDFAVDAGYWSIFATLIVSVAGSWALNFITLPGNWLIVAIAIGAAALPYDGQPFVSWAGVIVLLVLAAIGEGLEFLASAAGAAKQGASKRGVSLSILVAMVGSVLGAGAGVPVPVVGPLIGAVLGGGLGAFVGAYLGEAWKRGRAHRDRLSIAKAAFNGRLVGTVGKLLVGAIMVVVFVVALFL